MGTSMHGIGETPRQNEGLYSNLEDIERVYKKKTHEISRDDLVAVHKALQELKEGSTDSDTLSLIKNCQELLNVYQQYGNSIEEGAAKAFNEKLKKLGLNNRI